MYFFFFFLSGIVLFYLFLFFPVTSITVFFLTAALLAFAGRATNNTTLSALLSLRLACARCLGIRNPSDLCCNEKGFSTSENDAKCGLTYALDRKKRYLLILTLIFGFAYAAFWYSPPIDPSLLSNREVVIDGVVYDLPQETSSGRYVNKVNVGSVVDVATGEHIAALRGREINIISDEGLRQGSKYQIAAKSGRGGERLNPGMMAGDMSFAYLEEIRKTEIVRGNLLTTWFRGRRESLHRHLKETFERDSAALLSSITIGETSGMGEELKNAFSTTGLAHLLSISGTHFGLFSMLVFAVFRLMVRSMPYRILQRITIFVTPSQAAAIISLPFILIYLFISGASIPAVRSFIMINIFLLGLLIGRKGYWLNSLLLAGFLICLREPSAVTNISFQLSFLAVLFIGFFVVERGKEQVKDEVKVEYEGKMKMKDNRIVRLIRDPLLLTLSASLGTAPLVAYYFHYFSIISPISNLMLTPFIGFVLVPLSLAAAFTFIFTGYYPFQSLVSLATDVSIKGIKFFASAPFADLKIQAFPVIAIAVFYAGLLIYLLSGRKRYALLIPLAALLISLSPFMPGRKDMSVTYLDVGQGDSAVVETSGGKTIVIDTGRTGKEPEAYLRYLGKRDVDVLAVTHADDDHAAGVPYLMSRFYVKEVWDNGLLIYHGDLLKKVNIRSFERGDEAKDPGLAVQVLHPYKGFYTFADSEATAENNDSLVLRIIGKRKSFLFTADTAEEAEEDMLNLGKWLKSDVIKVAHHGSRTSSGKEFLHMVSPEIGVISVGKDNAYGHPHKETLERLQGTRIYRTDRDGAIKITETPSSGLAVKTFREFRFERARSLAGEWRNINRLFMRW